MITTLSYAGVGSRETPTEILGRFYRAAEYLAKRNFVLRSGGASGADQAFEHGCDAVNGPKEIYLSWKGFEGNKSTLIVSSPKAYELASNFHPYWDNLSMGAKKLQARNSHQIMGIDLSSPVKFVLCWTKNGSGQVS